MASAPPSPSPPGRPPGFVLDATVPVAWVLFHRGTRYADDVQTRLIRLPAIAPASWPLHLADIFLAEERAGMVPSTQVDRYLAGIRSYVVLIDGETPDRAWPDTLALARVHSLSLFDAAYLELAGRLGLPLATTDAALRRAAAAAGVPIFVP